MKQKVDSISYGEKGLGDSPSPEARFIVGAILEIAPLKADLFQQATTTSYLLLNASYTSL